MNYIDQKQSFNLILSLQIINDFIIYNKCIIKCFICNKLSYSLLFTGLLAKPLRLIGFEECSRFFLRRYPM